MFCLVALTAASYGEPLPLSDREWVFICQRSGEALKSGVCEVHNVAMKKTPAPIRYGLPAGPGPNEPTYVYRMIFFPHAQSFVEGGCIPMPNRTTEELYICGKCQSAEKSYLLQTNDSPTDSSK